MKNRLEVIGFSVIVRSPRPLPVWDSPKEKPYPDLFSGIFSVRHITGNQYEVACSQLSVFTVAGDLASLAELYEESMCEAEELAI